LQALQAKQIDHISDRHSLTVAELLLADEQEKTRSITKRSKRNSATMFLTEVSQVNNYQNQRFCQLHNKRLFCSKLSCKGNMIDF